MKRYVLIFAVLLASFTSCDKGFEDLNKNPLAPTDVNTGAIFNSIVSSLRLGWNRQLFLHNEVLYDVTEQAAVTAKTFGNISGGSEDVWSNYYTALKNAREIYKRLDALETKSDGDIMRAQVSIIMAYKTFQVTDFFGDIPYSEAGLAFDDLAIIRPVYDNQEDIYKKLIEDLKVASDLLRNGAGTLRFGSFDTFLGDNTDKWVRLSNSLMLRHLVRMHDKDPDWAQPRIKELIEGSNDVIIENGDIVMSPATQGWNNLGVNWSFREHNKVRMGSTIWDVMTEDDEIEDPRLNIFFEPNNAGEWKPFPQIPDNNTQQSGGEPYQKDRRDATYDDKGTDNIYSPVNFYLIRDELDIPEIIMTSAEVKFLLAEVFLRGLGVTKDLSIASSNYQKGMLESLQFWQDLMINSKVWVNKSEELSIAALFNVLQLPKFNIDMANTDDEKLRMIYTQRWIDNFRQPWEAFALLRRTNKVPRTKADNTFYRFEYPLSELSFNAENYSNQATKMGGDLTDVKIWWME